jgi:hypothetical protein
MFLLTASLHRSQATHSSLLDAGPLEKRDRHSHPVVISRYETDTIKHKPYILVDDSSFKIPKKLSGLDVLINARVQHHFDISTFVPISVFQVPFKLAVHCSQIYPPASPPSPPRGPLSCRNGWILSQSRKYVPLSHTHTRHIFVSHTVTTGICTFAAFLCTSFRIWIRRGNYWWDDGWAFFSLIFILMQVACQFLHGANPGEAQSDQLCNPVINPVQFIFREQVE